MAGHGPGAVFGRRLLVGVAFVALSGCSEQLLVMAANPCAEEVVVETAEVDVLGHRPTDVGDLDELVDDAVARTGYTRAAIAASTTVPSRRSAQVGAFCCVIRDTDEMAVLVRSANWLEILTANELEARGARSFCPPRCARCRRSPAGEGAFGGRLWRRRTVETAAAGTMAR